MEGPNKSAESLLYIAEFLFRECHNIFSAHFYIKLAEQEPMSIKTRYKLYVLKKIIKHTINPNEIGNKK